MLPEIHGHAVERDSGWVDLTAAFQAPSGEVKGRKLGATVHLCITGPIPDETYLQVPMEWQPSLQPGHRVCSTVYRHGTASGLLSFGNNKAWSDKIFCSGLWDSAASGYLIYTQ